MAFEELGPFDVTMIAGANFVDGDQYKAVEIASGKTVTIANAVGEHVFGVLQSGATASGDACTVRIFGITKMRAGAAITVPNHVKTNASGKFIAIGAAGPAVVNTSDAGAATDPVIGSFVAGQALIAAGADEDVFTGFFNQIGAIPTTAA